MMDISTSEAIRKCDWLHTIELPTGYVTEGRYDWRPYLEQFDLGKIDGKTVLDVGAGDGYFSFEFEKMGARVSALDLPSQEDRDNNRFGEGNRRTSQEHVLSFKLAFLLAKSLLGSKVEHIEMNLYDIAPARIGVFDIVFCSDVLLHLTDPFRALCFFKTVCGEKLVIGTPLYEASGFLQRLAFYLLKGEPIGYFAGAETKNAFWLPNLTCLKEMLTGAGFEVSKTVCFKPERRFAQFAGMRAVVTGLTPK